MDATLLSKLPLLQNAIKRDPAAYAEEFKLQYNNFLAELEIFKLSPANDSKAFRELIIFISHVASCYPKETADFPSLLMALLREHHPILLPDVRKTIAQCLMLMRNRGLIDVLPILQLFFDLFRCQDKVLRELMFSHVISDIRNMNQKQRNDKITRAIQAFLFTQLSSDHAITAKRALDVFTTLYRKQIWTDARTINAVAHACNSPHVKVLVGAVKFFLGVDVEDDDSEEEGETKEDSKPSRHAKLTRKRQKLLENSANRLKKSKKVKTKVAVFPAIQLINDPQGLCENLLKRLKSGNERFEVRLMMMNLASRLIGQHELIVLGFYSFFQRYLTAHQKNVTQILAYLAQACHRLVPPDELVAVVKSIANNFVVDKVPAEAIQVGLNGLREVIVRAPSVLEESGMDALMQDLVQYKSFRNKGVVIAARNVLNVVRELHPGLLKRKDRGKDHDMAARPLSYGEERVLTHIPGVELLAAEEALHGKALPAFDDASEWVTSMKNGNDSDSSGWPSDEDDDDAKSDDSAVQLTKSQKRRAKMAARQAKREADAAGEPSDEEGSDEDDEEEAGDEVEPSPAPKSSKKVTGKASGSAVSEEPADEDEDEDSNDGSADEEDDDDEAEEQDGSDDDDDDDDEEEEDDDDEDDDDDDDEDDEDDEEDDEDEDEDEEEEAEDPVPSSAKKARVSKVQFSEQTKDETKEPDTNAIAVVRGKLETSRILTPKDFERIAQLQKLAEKGKKRKRGTSMLETNDDNPIVMVDPAQLESAAEVRRRRALARLEEAKIAQVEFKLRAKGGGTTNQEKKRKKNFLMLRKSSDVQQKLKTTLRHKQKSLKSHLKNMELMSRRLKKRRT